MSEQRKAVIKNADMSEEMQQDAVDIASQALAKYYIEKVRRMLLPPNVCFSSSLVGCCAPSSVGGGGRGMAV